MTKICVLGLGYIGLPTALLLAKSGFEVIGVDVNERVVKTLNQGQLHISDPGLPELFEEARRNFAAQTVVPGSRYLPHRCPDAIEGTHSCFRLGIRPLCSRDDLSASAEGKPCDTGVHRSPRVPARNLLSLSLRRAV